MRVDIAQGSAPAIAEYLETQGDAIFLKQLLFTYLLSFQPHSAELCLILITCKFTVRLLPLFTENERCRDIMQSVNW